MKATTQRIDSGKISELAKDPSNRVYTYTHDTPDDTLSAELQATLLRDIVFEFDSVCRSNCSACDEEIRETIMKKNTSFRRFQRLYPMVFAGVTVRATNSEMEEKLDKKRKLCMLFAMEKWKGEGTIDEQHARAMHTAMRISMRDTKPEDLEGGTGVADVSMTPMSAEEFGESTVKQK